MSKYIDFYNIDDILADLTSEEVKEMETLEERYRNLLTIWKLEETQLQPSNPPKGWEEEGYLPRHGLESDEWTKYESRGSQEWKAKRLEWDTITANYNKERNQFYNKFQERRFTEIINRVGFERFFKDRIKAAEEAIIKSVKENDEKETSVYTEYGLNRIIKSYGSVIEASRNVLEKARSIQKEDIENLSYSKILEIINKQSLDVSDLLQVPKTKYPNEFITPKDKVSNMLFNGQLSKELQPLRMERQGRKELTTKVSIEFDELKDIQLSNRNITPYDREVHDAIVSLYIDGRNAYITPLMVFRTMTGQPQGKLTDKIFKDISESIERCSRTRVYIDATKEVDGKGYSIEQPIFKENLIYTRSISGTHNGEAGEWIEIISTPVLYRYASSKNQIARMDIKLLNTPVNKSEETIILQGYLQRRILSMKGSNLSRNILYETVYKQLDIKMASAASLRNKQSKIRDTIKNILEYWKEESFIKDFKENTGPRNSKISISIVLEN